PTQVIACPGPHPMLPQDRLIQVRPPLPATPTFGHPENPHRHSNQRNSLPQISTKSLQILIKSYLNLFLLMMKTYPEDDLPDALNVVANRLSVKKASQ